VLSEKSILASAIECRYPLSAVLVKITGDSIGVFGLSFSGRVRRVLSCAGANSISYSVPYAPHDLDDIPFDFWVYRASAVRILNPDPLWVWLPTGALVRINVVPGSISARTSCRKDGSIEIRSFSSFKFGAFLPTLAV
jgi:hypothetical protein